MHTNPTSPASRLFAILCAFTLSTSPAYAQSLGQLTFPNSGAARAQTDFVRGMLYLHSFEYGLAAQSFQAAQTKDSGFALAYWGEAMTYNHGLWDEQDLAAGRAALARLGASASQRAAKAPTAREKGLLEAVDLLYGEGSKAQRDTLYTQVLERLSTANPKDDEIKLFYALALMSESQAVRNVPTYMRAGAMALEVLERHPNHPGAAHYVIHAFDDPTHAPLGLRAAHAYSRIAPDAAHAQHMTTHIFVALGMWPETVSQNIIASGPDRSRWQPGHYTYWMHYALLQQGRFDEAAELLDLLRRNSGSGASFGRRMHLTLARAQQIATGQRWDDPALGWDLSVSDGGATPRAIDAFVQGWAQLNRGDRAAAERTLGELVQLQGADPGRYGGSPKVPALLAGELRAALLRAQDKKAEATAMLAAVSDSLDALPLEYGPPDMVKPPRELLGEWLLADGDAAGAQHALTRALELLPGRLRSLQGLAEAASRTGDVAVADWARAQLAKNPARKEAAR